MLAAAALRGLPATGFDQLDWQPDQAWRQPWRWWTAALLHWSLLHWAMNALSAGLVALLGWRAGLGPRAVATWMLAWPLTQLGLLAQPALRHYAGLSGVLHAAVAITGASLLARRGERRGQAIGALVCAGLLLKIVFEAPWAGATREVAGWDFALAPAAHASGALAGWLAWVLVGRERATARGPSAGPLPSRPAVPSGAEPGHEHSGGLFVPGEDLGIPAQRGLQGRPTYPSDEGPP